MAGYRQLSSCCPSCTNRHLCAAVSSVDVSEYCIPQVDIPLVEANEYMVQRVHTGYSWITAHTRLQVICVTERRLLLYCFHPAPSLIASRIFIVQAVARFNGSPRGIFCGQSSARTGISDPPPTTSLSFHQCPYSIIYHQRYVILALKSVATSVPYPSHVRLCRASMFKMRLESRFRPL